MVAKVNFVLCREARGKNSEDFVVVEFLRSFAVDIFESDVTQNPSPGAKSDVFYFLLGGVMCRPGRSTEAGYRGAKTPVAVPSGPVNFPPCSVWTTGPYLSRPVIWCKM